MRFTVEERFQEPFIYGAIFLAAQQCAGFVPNQVDMRSAITTPGAVDSGILGHHCASRCLASLQASCISVIVLTMAIS